MTKLCLLHAQLLLLSFDNFEELSRPQIHFLVVGVNNNMNIRNFKNSIRMILGVGVAFTTLVGSANADMINNSFAFNIDPVRSSPDAAVPTIADFFTQNPDSNLDISDEFFNLVGGGNFTNVPANLSGVTVLTSLLISVATI